ncbi:hypothetical protein M3226_24465 [Neobacillus cucumis]|uniref:hypothetical protein n=1 Tax=Neobacillus cucumis TaxID=1740721 RepID=UPI00203F38D5|nr:hypothetical protein [Neobacillus cucumis]MCM3728801.1 hypothetical protein [Neobacillus cucumis]
MFFNDEVSCQDGHDTYPDPECEELTRRSHSIIRYVGKKKKKKKNNNKKLWKPNIENNLAVVNHQNTNDACITN